MLLVGWGAIAGVLHASFSHAQMKTLRADRFVPKFYTTDRNTLYTRRADVFIACDEQERLHYFFHTNHTLFSCGWGLGSNTPTKALELSRLRAWHLQTFGRPLEQELADPSDRAAWENKR